MEASKGRVLCYKNQPPPLTPPSGPSRQCWALLVGINTLSGLSPAETGRALEELARHDIVMQLNRAGASPSS
jgi:hypothetical protein